MLLKKIYIYISEGEEISENMNDTEIEYDLVEGPINIDRASNERTRVSQYLNIFNEEKCSSASG